jgi:hypothetical protein
VWAGLHQHESHVKFNQNLSLTESLIMATTTVVTTSVVVAAAALVDVVVVIAVAIILTELLLWLLLYKLPSFHFVVASLLTASVV